MTTADSGSDFQSLLDSEEHTPRLERGTVLTGQVLALDAQGMIVDLGQKRDGVVLRAEVDRLAQSGKTFKVGDAVTVMVTNPEDKDGNLVVSVSQGKHQQDWLNAEQLQASGEVWEGTVTGHNKGGLIVQFGEIQAFVPNSQVLDLPRDLPEADRPARLQSLVGRKMGFKVIEVDRQRRRLVLSQRKAQLEYRDKQRTALFDELTEGQVRRGVVTALREFGAFVDLGGADGLIHISELSWQRVKHANEVLKVGQEVEVEVLKVDREAKRIGLSLKRRLADPWSRVAERFQIGQVVDGAVTRVAPFGAFVDLGEGIEGLLHSSQWGGESAPAEGEALLVKILRIDGERQRIGLGLQGRPSAPPAPPLDEPEPSYEHEDEE